MRRMVLSVALAAVAGTGTLAETDEAGFLPYRDAEAVALGAVVYQDVCASCHGTELEGQVEDWRDRDEDGLLPAPPHDETGHTWHHADALLFDIVKRGTEAIVGGTYRSNMMGFADTLSDEEILAVLAFIKSTWPDEVIDVHNQINENEALYRN